MIISNKKNAAMSALRNQHVNGTRASTTSNKSNLNKSYELHSVSNNSSMSSTDNDCYRFCLSDYKANNFVETDLLETNIKEIEYTLFRLMDNEKEVAANRSQTRLASISNVKNKLYMGENSVRRTRIASVTKNRKNSSNNNSSLSPEVSSCSKENIDPAPNTFLDSSPYFSSPESKSNGNIYSYCDMTGYASNHVPSSILNSSYSAISINSVDHSSPRVYQNYDSFSNSPKLSPSPSIIKKKNLMNMQYYGESNFGNSDHYMSNNAIESSNVHVANKNLSYTYHSQDGLNQMNYNNKSESPFQSPNPNQSNGVDSFKSNNQTNNNNNNKKSVKMSVPSNKRQVLEEEFRKEKYPCNEKLQKLSNRLNMKYDEVQNYFKKRRREEKETNNKFTNLVKLLNNYLEQE